jgi:hypothetical protein
MKTKILVLLFIICFPVACKSPQHAAGVFEIMMNIEGIVTDEITQHPISGVKIEILELGWPESYKVLFTANTNKEGKFTINKRYPGYCTNTIMIISAEKEGYVPFRHSWDFDNNRNYLSCTHALQRVDIQLEPY